MNIVALIKYIPNPEGTPQMGPDYRLRREGVEGALDPGDEHVVEAALQLAEQSGGEVTVLSMSRLSRACVEPCPWGRTRGLW